MKTEQLLTMTKTPAGIPVITERLPQTPIRRRLDQRRHRLP